MNADHFLLQSIGLGEDNPSDSLITGWCGQGSEITDIFGHIHVINENVGWVDNLHLLSLPRSRFGVSHGLQFADHGVEKYAVTTTSEKESQDSQTVGLASSLSKCGIFVVNMHQMNFEWESEISSFYTY